jgi:hypothetical protein
MMFCHSSETKFTAMHHRTEVLMVSIKLLLAIYVIITLKISQNPKKLGYSHLSHKQINQNKDTKNKICNQSIREDFSYLCKSAIECIRIRICTLSLILAYPI